MRSARITLLCSLGLLLSGTLISAHADTALSQAKKDDGKKLVLFSESRIGPQPLVLEQERYLAFGQSMFNFYRDHKFLALTQLVENQKRGLFDQSTDYASLLMGELYVAYGLSKPAEVIFNKLLKKDILTRTRAETWLHKAELHYHQGQLDDARDILESDKIKGLAPKLASQRDLVLANVLIAMKQFSKAQRVLASVPDNSPDRVFADYNIAVAMVRNQQIDAGLKLLAKVYNRPKSDPTHDAVRDRAALTAGLVNLKEKHYSAAINALARVNTDGPFSNDAMLILGLSFFDAGLPQKALPLWLALVNRNSADSSVQEALALAPQAYEKLGALPQALTGYRYAANTYRQELRKVESAIFNIDKGTWLRSLLPTEKEIRQNLDPMSTVAAVQSKAGPETLYLYRLFSSRSFAQKFKQYQQIQRLGMLLARWSEELGTLENTFVLQRQYLSANLPGVRAKLADMNHTQQQLDEKIQLLQIPMRLDMRHFNDITTPSQWVMWQTVERLQKSHWQGSEQLRRVRGLLLWDIAHHAPATRQAQDKDRSALLNDSQLLGTRIAALNQLVEDANQHINSKLDAKFIAKQATINKLLAQDKATLKALQKSMATEAIGVLANIRADLVEKLAQANLAEARLQDRSVNPKSGATP